MGCVRVRRLDGGKVTVLVLCDGPTGLDRRREWPGPGLVLFSILTHHTAAATAVAGWLLSLPCCSGAGCSCAVWRHDCSRVHGVSTLAVVPVSCSRRSSPHTEHREHLAPAVSTSQCPPASGHGEMYSHWSPASSRPALTLQILQLVTT